MKIGELAGRAGITAKTIRYYEDIGLLPEPDRTANGYRDYAEDMVDRLDFIRDAQAAGLTLTEIASILDLRSHGENTCRHVIDLLERHTAALDRHIKNLRATRRKLSALTQEAKELDPAECVDPHRCQTITPAAPMPSARNRHLHSAPQKHIHR